MKRQQHLGCRFATSFRAVVDQGRVRGGEWVAVHGCGGVGLSAVMIAAAMGARVIAVDIDANTLQLAHEMGAEVLVTMPRACTTLPGAIREATKAVLIFPSMRWAVLRPVSTPSHASAGADGMFRWA